MGVWKRLSGSITAVTLCNELEITVNELLTGERISQQNYKKKAEENMVNMIREKE